MGYYGGCGGGCGGYGGGYGGGYPVGGAGYYPGRNFALIVVLFILLIIVGCACWK